MEDLFDDLLSVSTVPAVVRPPEPKKMWPYAVAGALLVVIVMLRVLRKPVLTAKPSKHEVMRPAATASPALTRKHEVMRPAGQHEIRPAGQHEMRPGGQHEMRPADAQPLPSDVDSLVRMYVSQGMTAEDAMFFANARATLPMAKPLPVTPVDDVIIVSGPVPFTVDEDHNTGEKVMEDDPRILSMLAGRKDFTK